MSLILIILGCTILAVIKQPQVIIDDNENRVKCVFNHSGKDGNNYKICFANEKIAQEYISSKNKDEFVNNYGTVLTSKGNL